MTPAPSRSCAQSDSPPRRPSSHHRSMWRSTDRQRPSSPTRSSPPNRNRPRPEPPRRAAPTFDPRQHNASTQTLEPTTVNDHRSSPHAIGGTVSTAQIKPCQVTAVGNGPHSVVARRSRRFRRSRRDPQQLIGRPHGRPCFRFAAGLLAVEPHVPASRGKRARRRPRLILLRRGFLPGVPLLIRR
jgi:hypothetical protein